MNEVNVFCRTKKNKRFVCIAQQTIIQVLHALKQTRCTVEVFIVGNFEMKKLHRKTTNVLSYPASKKFPHPEIRNKVLGEIYLNPVYITQHGENFQYCTIHGLLHLFGYNHKSEKGAQKMERREAHLLKELQNIK